jgi:hypothetical protein
MTLSKSWRYTVLINELGVKECVWGGCSIWRIQPGANEKNGCRKLNPIIITINIILPYYFYYCNYYYYYYINSKGKVVPVLN